MEGRMEMKVRMLFLAIALYSLAAIPTFSQAQPPQPLAIVKLSWERERLTLNPSMAPLASAEELAETSRRERQLAAARTANDTGRAGKLETDTINHTAATAKAREGELPRDGYRYKVTLRNDTDKIVKSVEWDYLFIDPTSNEIAMRHQFASDETIKPGKTKEISVLYLVPPVKTVTVRMLVKKDPLPFSEKVVIARVRFADGSTWQAN
jgi:hypothetical protein